MQFSVLNSRCMNGCEIFLISQRDECLKYELTDNSP